MTDTVVVDNQTSAIVSSQDVEVVTLSSSQLNTLTVENSGAVVDTNVDTINFRNNLTVLGASSGEVRIDVDTGVMLVDGSRAMTGALDMGSNNVNNAANLVDLGSAQTITGAKTFSALQTFSSGINLGDTTLSNYKEGTFTPTLQGSTTAGSHTYTTQSGRYTRIGNLVWITIDVDVSTVDSGWAGNLEVGGLPFTIAAGNNPGFTASVIDNIAFGDQLLFRGLSGSKNIRLQTVTGTTGGVSANIAVGSAGSNPRIMLSGVYEV